MDATYEKRAQAYGEEYSGTEPREINALFIATGEWIEHLSRSSSAADAAMKALYAELVGMTGVEPNATWRDLWNDGVSSGWESGNLQIAIELHAFAFWGLRPDPRVLDLREDEKFADAIKRCIIEMRALLEMAPTGWADLSGVERTIRAAEARIRLDLGSNVTPEQLAALAEVSVKSIKNLLASQGGSASLKLDVNGEIARLSVLDWLKDRSNFRASIWREQTETEADIEAAQPLDDVVFVPVARDGSWFDPVSCRNSRGFTIGQKGAEVPVGDYREALDQLSRMRTPYWRRPNAVGNWGVVAGVEWQRREVRELDRLMHPYAGGDQS